MKYFLIFIAVFVYHGFNAWVNSQKWVDDEMKRNESYETPTEHQLKWHLRHMRHDLAKIYFVVTGIFGLLFFYIVGLIIKSIE
jgi:hypothetical protein